MTRTVIGADVALRLADELTGPARQVRLLALTALAREVAGIARLRRLTWPGAARRHWRCLT